MFVKGFAKKGFIKKREGVFARVISGKNAQLAWAKLSPGQCADHKHNHEQLGIILSGNIKVTIGNESKNLGPGDAYCIPANVRHGFKVRGDKEAQYFEVFSPPKQENLFLTL
jgi:quercetin dioxygenase-like cupin family protein